MQLGNLHGGVCGRLLGEKPALDGCRDNPLAHVLTGIFDAERGVRAHGGRRRDVILFKGVFLPVAVEADHAQNLAVQRQRRHDQGVGTGPLDGVCSGWVGG